MQEIFLAVWEGSITLLSIVTFARLVSAERELKDIHSQINRINNLIEHVDKLNGGIELLNKKVYNLKKQVNPPKYKIKEQVLFINKCEGYTSEAMIVDVEYIGDNYKYKLTLLDDELITELKSAYKEAWQDQLEPIQQDNES